MFDVDQQPDTDIESLRWRFNRQSYLRPIDLARAVNLSVTQIRTYEQLGFLPPAERGPNGYRRYSMAHAEALRVARILIAGYGWQHALDVMRAIHYGDTSTVFAEVDSRHAALDHLRGQTRATLDAIDAVMRRDRSTSGQSRASSMRISEAAAVAGVRPSAVRFWEQQELLQPEREPRTGYRRYDSQQLTRLNIVVLLRQVGYNFDAIRGVLDELSSGRPHQVQAALEERLKTLDDATARCIEATKVLHDYMSALAESTGHA